jgi:hypothetical protein
VCFVVYSGRSGIRRPDRPGSRAPGRADRTGGAGPSGGRSHRPRPLLGCRFGRQMANAFTNGPPRRFRCWRTGSLSLNPGPMTLSQTGGSRQWEAVARGPGDVARPSWFDRRVVRLNPRDGRALRILVGFPQETQQLLDDIGRAQGLDILSVHRLQDLESEAFIVEGGF